MAGICFYFEHYGIDVWSGRKIDFDAWRYACSAAGDIDKMWVINKTPEKLQNPDRKLDFNVSKEMPKLEGTVTYFDTPWRNEHAKSLWDFDHNTDWYVFGPANGWPKIMPNTVAIPQDGTGACHSVHIVTVVMMHRYKILNAG